MLARFVMDTDFLSGVATDTLILAQWWMQTSPHRTVYVLDDGGKYLGLVRLADAAKWNEAGTLADHMLRSEGTMIVRPGDDVEGLSEVFAKHTDWPSIPVVDADGRLVGVITRDLPLGRREAAPNFAEAVSQGILQRHLLGALNSGFLIVDANGVIRQLNAYGAELLGVSVDDVVDRPYEEAAQWMFPHMRDYLRHSAVPEVLTTSVVRGERELLLQNGRHVQFSFGTVRDQASDIVAIAITFVDVTAVRQAEARAEEIAREAEMAFGLALPNTKVEAKLKASPEYQDIYDPDTGRATVTKIIPNGTYWHVINGLRIMAELKAIGMFQLVGLDKDTVVQAFIFHDLGKEQPELAVGQSFVPEETFEPGYKHAARSADWAAREYHVSSDVEWLIRYHHTDDPDLPDDFPGALKPMWRLLRLVDGLSAGMTRRGAKVSPISRNGTTLTIQEDNQDQRYHRTYAISIYSGEQRSLSPSL